jgi:phosphoribosylglycinamide formyltransferase 1
MKNIAIFASGGGSNASKILAYFQGSDSVKVALIISNKKDAGVLDIAKAYQVETLVIDRTYFYDSQAILQVFAQKNIDFVVLAGFLWLMPSYLVQQYERRMVNIHPALLPKYGGKGMYGMHVHEAVKAAGEQQSGMTIHYVNTHYDEGDIIFQAICDLSPEDTASDIARKVLALEHEHFPRVIERLLQNGDDEHS